MASLRSALLVTLLICTPFVWAEVEDLQPLLTSTEHTLQEAKTHVEHMLGLSPLPNQDQLPPIVKNESQHLAYEANKLATALKEKISVGEHKPEVKEAVDAAVTHLTEAAATLEHVGSDLKADNTKYYAAADKMLSETKNIYAASPCPEITPVLKAALNELTHDINNYQYGIHGAIGPHQGGPENKGHKHEGHSHHVHHHHGASSEESKSSEESSSGHHHHNHNHHHH